jgi:hypothetical protein
VLLLIEDAARWYELSPLTTLGAMLVSIALAHWVYASIETHARTVMLGLLKRSSRTPAGAVVFKDARG